MIDMSFAATMSAKERDKIRPPKEWIIPANPKFYDMEHAFDEKDEIEWKQGAGIKAEDTVFMYVAAPISAILYKCKVTETDIPYAYEDKHLTITALMKIKLQKRYRPARFSLGVLREEYGIYSIRGPREYLTVSVRLSGNSMIRYSTRLEKFLLHKQKISIYNREWISGYME